MTVLTIEEIEKLPHNVYIPCVYAFKGDIQKHLGYIYVNSYKAYLKHNDIYYDGSGSTGVKGCRYSWRLYDSEEGRDWLHVLKCLAVDKYVIGEI